MVTNRTRQYAYALVEAAISGSQDVETAMAAMRDVGAEMRADAKIGPSILGDLEVWGVDRWELWGMLLRGRIKTLPRDRDGVRREFNRRLGIAFERRGLKMR
jgi:moderate conductance mechanosensitive channel